MGTPHITRFFAQTYNKKKRVVSFSVHTYTAHKSVPFKRGREHDGGERIAQPTFCYIQSPMQHKKECIILVSAVM
jgi:hypothetical protein